MNDTDTGAALPRPKRTTNYRLTLRSISRDEPRHGWTVVEVDSRDPDKDICRFCQRYVSTVYFDGDCEFDEPMLGCECNGCTGTLRRRPGRQAVTCGRDECKRKYQNARQAKHRRVTATLYK